MIHFSKFRSSANPQITKKNGKEYLELSCSFDIESSSITVGGEKIGVPYIWMLNIYGENVYYGRELSDFNILLDKLREIFKLDNDRILVIYVHNLPFDFQFIHKHLEITSLFATAPRKPLKFSLEGFEFRCSYILSGYSLDNLAKNLTKHTMNKQVGKLDYDLIRTPNTKLFKPELKYCAYDVKIITAYISEQIDLYKSITKIPLTNTGRVRDYVRNECYYTSNNHHKTDKAKFVKYSKLMSDLTLDSDTYLQLKRAFQGGFTHANYHHVGKVLNNVSSYDFNSSYPSVMLSEKFPMSRFKKVNVKSLAELEFICKTKAVLFDVKFINITPKFEYENYLSYSKCYNVKNEVLNNGRIYSADELITTLTEIDYAIIKKCYNFENMKVTNVRIAEKGYLPKAIITSVLKLYRDKTTLKDIEGQEVEYMLSKGMLNSVYGMTVTDLMNDENIYSCGEWSQTTPDLNEKIKEYNKSKKRFLYYPWGVWITAYSRLNLWTGILTAKADYVYSDTDSIKILNAPKYSDYLERYNKLVEKKLLNMAKYYSIDVNDLFPANKKGVVKVLGAWDFEGTFTFKTLGAKRYMIKDESGFKITVAGLSKKRGFDYIARKCGNDENEIFNFFDDGLFIPHTDTGKLTHTYIDEVKEIELVDYLGNRAYCRILSSIHLEKTSFNLGFSSNYREFLNKLSSGYIFKGVKYV